MTRLRAERGLTLVELIVAISIVGIAFVALISGMYSATVSADLHRKQSTSGAALRSYAEAIKRETYVSCATTGSYGSSYSPPSGYTKSVTQVEYHAADAANPAVATFQGTCPASDQGVQRLTLQIASADGRAAETLAFVKRCTGARPSPCP